MQLSVLANLYGAKSLEETLQILTSLGVHTAEIGAGGYPGKAHCNPAELLADEKKFKAFVNTFKKYDVEICALACHGNPLHPDKATAVTLNRAGIICSAGLIILTAIFIIIALIAFPWIFASIAGFFAGLI